MSLTKALLLSLAALTSAFALTVSPASATLYPTATQAFTCSGSDCSGITWSVSGPGSVDSSGNYTAPTTLTAPASATVTATGSSGDQMASATVTLDVAVTPVEVYGGLGIASVTQSLYLPTAPTGTVTLEIQVHNVRWDGQASVKVNNMATTVINNTNCYVPNAIANAWGGITGGFDVVTCRILRLPANTVTQGANTITWYYNGTDGRVAGYRVLSFQLIDSTPTNLIPAAEFYYTDRKSVV